MTKRRCEAVVANDDGRCTYAARVVMWQDGSGGHKQRFCNRHANSIAFYSEKGWTILDIEEHDRKYPPGEGLLKPDDSPIRLVDDKARAVWFR